ncbi:MAG: Peptidase M16 inactive domain protein [Bacteroidetes bacterium ADurb.Bin217]|nr:MAG: Peptidase M16 inactive domain protein [Bacteroidetes bacterium ADurb.Bin217]
MITYETFTLHNGLQFIINIDKNTPFVAINTLYDVGSKDESPDKTGFAHLFEHLMFGGSKHIPSFDTPLQKVGGENNAFTNTDITNYYITLPKDNIETGFWLESDRMLELAFSQKNLDTQKSVVIEEFKQRYLNRPYGDTWLLLRPLAYTTHPYMWPTIGKDISHIEQAVIKDVTDFFYRHYAPNNAIISISGNVSVREIKKLAKKWYENIPQRDIIPRNLPKEPEQLSKRTLSVERNVPVDTIYKVFHMCNRLHPDFYTSDIISDILSNGKSARLYTNLVQNQRLFSEINAYITGEIDEGLFVISGNIMPGIRMEQAEQAIYSELEKLTNGFVFDYELQKVTNKIESTIIFSETNVLNKAMNLAKFAHLGDVSYIQKEIENYTKVSSKDIQRVASQLFKESNDSTLYYYSTQKK